ncbi:hypothetical protein J8J14_05650 [Roseomonas sp. SSH11]|uniref:Uncharacterized protein n=1 Tax=Pararoseomonas baculiformis TaxID=2820812 RepID=A0ABS4AB78_9PROT|nr:hypothetical protein [Pararoseomonas baculiformis]MBP0444258.1 hypothetical protein [Pararoseomonas baculiformis]
MSEVRAPAKAAPERAVSWGVPQAEVRELLLQRRMGDARLLVKELAADHPTAPEPLLLAASIASAEGEWDAGTRSIERAFEISPWHPEATRQLAQRWFLDGNVPAIVALMGRATAEAGQERVPLIGHLGIETCIEAAAFDIARKAMDVMDAGERQLERRAQLARAEQEWAEGTAQLQARKLSGPLRKQLGSLAKAGKDAAFSTVLRRYLLAEDTSPEDLMRVRTTVSRLHRPILSRWAVWTMRRRHPMYPPFVLEEVVFLSLAGGHKDAGRLCAAANPDGISADALLRAAAYMALAGGLHASDLEQLSERLGPHLDDPGIATLARRFVEGTGQRPVRRDLSLGSPMVSARRLPFLRQPQIAICLSGQLRGYRYAWPATKRVIDGMDAAVFVSTWADAGVGFGQRGQVVRRLPPGVAPRMNPDHFGEELYTRSFPRVSAMLSQQRSHTADELRQYFSTPHVEVHDEAAFDREYKDKPGLHWLNKLNQAKMFYMIHACNQQKVAFEQASGKRFDVVIRLRCDNGITHLEREDVLYAAQEPICLVASTSTKFYDRFAMMNGAVADQYASVWEGLRREGSSRYFAGSSGQFAEHLLGEHVIDQGVAAGLLRGTQTTALLSDQLPIDVFGQTLAEELTGRQELDVFETDLVVATLEAMAAARAKAPFAALWRAVPADAAAAWARLRNSFVWPMGSGLPKPE